MKPKIICLSGSLRFKDEFQKQELNILMRGEIALLPCCMFTDIQREHGEISEYKLRADENHKLKIDLADEVFVLNVGGYIGNSTRGEIQYAQTMGKRITFLEDPEPECCTGDAPRACYKHGWAHATKGCPKCQNGE